jgi:ribosomal protein L37E
MSERKEIRCYRCGRQVKEGGVGDFNLQSKYVSFCGYECRTLFWQKDKGVHKPFQKQSTIFAFASP